MEVVQRLPKPQDPTALARLVDAQRILCARFVSEEDCEQAQALLEELAAPPEAGGFGYFPALLTLASLFEAGFEPAIEQDGLRAARYYLRLLTHAEAATGLSSELLDEAATSLCSLVKDGGALLEDEEVAQLGKLSKGEFAGATGSVASWARFAHTEAEKKLQEAREDPTEREQRLARKAVREAKRAEQLAEQKEVAKAALAKAEALRQQGNDDYRQGQMPGNSRAKVDLARAAQSYSDAAEELTGVIGQLSVAVEEAVEVRRQRGLLHSNAAQVQIAAERWEQAAAFARLAMEDDPSGPKPRYRLARSLVALRKWEEAAQTVDDGLNELAKASNKDADDIKLELWKLAEEITKALPTFQWSSAKPAPKESKPAEDFEKRIVGMWEYGPEGSMQCYEIVLEQWGALYWKEKDMRIDLLRKGKLRWRGEYEMVSGMVLSISYEPGSDVLITDFTPPTDIPEDQQWKGPTKFTARRIAKPSPPPTEPEKTPEPEPVKAAPPAAPRVAEAEAAAAEDAAVEEEAPSLPVDTPAQLWLTGGDAAGSAFVGRYDLQPDAAPPGAKVGSSAVYRRTSGASAGGATGASGNCWLWCRGGNWGVTTSMNASPLAAPFLARCPDTSGMSRQPMEVRRPRWYVRKGRGQEELDGDVRLLASQPPTAPATSSSATFAPPARRGEEPVASAAPPSPSSASAAPAAVLLAGREGRFAEVNGRYDRASSSWRGLPVYVQADYPLEQERPYHLFFDGTCWTLAPEPSSVPRAVARRRDLGVVGCDRGGADDDSGPPPPPHPAAAAPGGGASVWEFMSSESNLGSMVTTSTRTFCADRRVTVAGIDADGAVMEVQTSAPPSAPSSSPSSFPPRAAAAAAAAAGAARATSSSSSSSSSFPSWAASVEAEAVGEEVKAAIVVREGVKVDLSQLDLEVGSQVLNVRLGGEAAVLELPLPVPVATAFAAGAAGGPTARWSEKSRTLKVRLALAPAAPAAPAAEEENSLATDGMD